MRTNVQRNQNRRGFNMVEMTGVLCLLAVLAGILIPRVMGAVNDAKLVATIKTVKAMTAATENYFRQYGKLAYTNGTAIPAWNNTAFEYWDREVLLKEQFIQKRLECSLAPTCYVRLVQISVTTSNVNILSAPGQIGHIPAFNSNNGLYSLTQEYAVNTILDPNAPVYAMNSIPAHPCNAGLAGLTGSGAWSRLMAGLIGAPSRFGSVQTSSKIIPPWKGVSQSLGQMFGSGVSPIQCCYPVPTGWTPPTVTIGGGGGGGTGGGGALNHDDPPAINQVVASSSSSPVIVAELVMEGITVTDAFRLSMALDGRTQSNWAYFDSLGRVKYDMYDGGGGIKKGVLFVYLGQK